MAWLHLSTAARNAAANAIVDLINTGGTGKVMIYSGAGPASANSTATGTLLAEVEFNATLDAFQDAVLGVATGNTLQTTVGLADADAGWARVVDGNGATVFDVDVGETSSTLILDPVGVVTDADVQITSATITMPDGTEA